MTINDNRQSGFNLRAILLSLLSLCFSFASAEILEPVKWTVKISDFTDNGNATITYRAKIDKGWHLYSTQDNWGEGPIPTSFVFTQKEGVTKVYDINPRTKAKTDYESMFDMQISWFEDEAVFTQIVNISDPNDFTLVGYIHYMCCDNETCLPPAKKEFDLSRHNPKPKQVSDTNTVVPGESAQTPTDVKKNSVRETKQPAAPKDTQQTFNFEPVKPEETQGPQTVGVGPVNTGYMNDDWAPVIDEMQQFGEEEDSDDKSSLWKTFLEGLLGGLIAVITPCVWPIIPMTVSFFLKRGGDSKKGKRDAILYGASIVVIYVVLGIVITLAVGATGLNDLSTNAIFNIFIFLLLVLFAASFFGGFEITLPSTWSTKIDQQVDKSTGLLSILFMAFTLVIVSFSCTGPIIGTLLVHMASEGKILGPALGMLGFSLSLAIPFTLFAFFPQWLHNMPKSGGWLNSVKVMLGFFELAFALKFLSMADLAYGWRILDREVFIVIWIAIFLLAGAYLLGWIKFSGDDESETVSTPRLFLSLATFSFAFYLLPGLWGAPLKVVSAFVPPLTTQDFNLYTGKTEPKFLDYDEAMFYAKSKGLPLVIDFTGHGCVNCRKMEAAVWSDPRVSSILKNDYVLVSLYTDERAELEAPMQVVENGKKKTLSTVGEKWSYLERTKFGANSQPFYVILDTDGHPLNTSFGFTEDVQKFLKYLRTGLKNNRDAQRKNQ